MELHFEISDKFAELILSYARKTYEPEAFRLLLGKGPAEVSRLIGIIVSDVLQESPLMKDEIETNDFGGWIKPSLREITVSSSLNLTQPLGS